MSNYVCSFFGLDGKVALVAGASSGLGEGIARGYARCGARVALVDIDEENLQRVEREILEAGGNAASFVCNVASSSQVQTTVQAAIRTFGKIDVDVNVAGIGVRSPAEQMTDEVWDKVIAVNLNGVFYFCREVGNHMIERGDGGRIINMASIGGVVGVSPGTQITLRAKVGSSR